MWGVTVTLSWDQKGCSCGKGSSLKTSNVHPESFPLSSAFRRSLSSINPPLPALIKIAPVLTILSEFEKIYIENTESIPPMGLMIFQNKIPKPYFL